MVLENLKTLFLRINKIRVLIVFDGTFFFLRFPNALKQASAPSSWSILLHSPWKSITTINASLGIPFKNLRRFRKCVVSRTLEEHFLAAGFKKLSTYLESFTVADWYPATIGLRGGSYNLQKLQDVAKEISKVDREGLLHYKSKPSPVSKIPKDLFTQWHPQISKLSFILKKHKDILTGSPELSQCFPEAPKVMYRRKRSIKDILCKSDIAKPRYRVIHVAMEIVFYALLFQSPML